MNNSQQDIKLQFSGSNIQIIKDKTGAFVYVDKENVSAQYAGRCIIRGNSVQVLAAEKRVHELLARRDMMLMDNGGQKTGKKSGSNEKHDSSPDSSQVNSSIGAYCVLIRILESIGPIRNRHLEWG